MMPGNRDIPAGFAICKRAQPEIKAIAHEARRESGAQE